VDASFPGFPIQPRRTSIALVWLDSGDEFGERGSPGNGYSQNKDGVLAMR